MSFFNLFFKKIRKYYKTMKRLLFTNNKVIMESAAKNVHNPRKGSTMYLLKDGETKAIKVTVVSVTKVKNSWYSKGSGGCDIVIGISDNEYGIDTWIEPHYGKDWDYSDEKYQVRELFFGDEIGKVYVGTTKEAIKQYISARGSSAIKGLSTRVAELKKELEEAEKKLAQAEANANIEITESLK